MTGIDVLLKDNVLLDTDMVVLAFGVTTEPAFARDDGLATVWRFPFRIYIQLVTLCR